MDGENFDIVTIYFAFFLDGNILTQAANSFVSTAYPRLAHPVDTFIVNKILIQTMLSQPPAQSQLSAHHHKIVREYS